MYIKEKFLRALDSFGLKSGVVVALSGGADSVCLLDLFVSAKAEGRFPYPIIAAHLNHKLRGEESERDADFCKSLCESYGIKSVINFCDVKSFAKSEGMSIEEKARQIRYGFLEWVCEGEDGVDFIATAHHRGDMCETLLLNLARGSSIDGLCSIPRRRSSIIRPLLDVGRDEIIAYNEEKGLTFVTDSTNSDTIYSRNRVRHNILPEFEKIYKGYEENFERTVRLLTRDADFLTSLAREEYAKVIKDGVLYTEKAQNIHLSLLTRIIKMLYNYHGYKDISEAYINAICEKIQSGDKNFTLSLHGCNAVCERGKLTFVNTVCEAVRFCFDISIGESVELPTGLTVTLSEAKTDGGYPLKKSAFGEKLLLRSREDGDTIKIFGKTHKIKRIISDKKLSAKEKTKIFFLCSSGDIIYSNIPATADCAFVRKGEDDCYYIIVKDTIK